MSYFILYGDEDGVQVEEYETKKELLDYISNEDNLTNMFGDKRSFREYLVDFEYSPRSMVVIKGDIVVPTPKETVKSYEVE